MEAALKRRLMLQFRLQKLLQHAATANRDHLDRQEHQEMTENKVKTDTMGKTDRTAVTDKCLRAQSHTSRVSSAQQVHQETRELPDRRDPVARRDNPASQERTATRVPPVFRDLSDSKDQSVLQDLPDHLDSQDDSSKSTDQLDPRAHLDHQDPLDERASQEWTVPTLAELPDHQATMATLDQPAHQDLRDHKGLQDLLENLDLASTALHLALLPAINRQAFRHHIESGNKIALFDPTILIFTQI